MTENVFGVDVAKNWIDVSSAQGHERIDNDRLETFARHVARHGGRVVFEASGGCEAPLREALAKAGVVAIRVNPRYARGFALSLGRLAKTDRVDAGVLREMGLRLDLPECPPEPEELRELKALQVRRRQLVADRKREKTRRGQTRDAAMRASVDRVLGLLGQEIAGLEAAISALIRATPALRQRAELLASAPGIGPVCTTALLAEMPELGQLGPRQLAALAGLAPLARDSGLKTGRRRIGGGRKGLRDVLYMAALSAARHDPNLREFAERLRRNGKAPKQAIIAVARKLLIILNAMVRENSQFQPS